MGTREELERFVASLAIPADRKAVVLAELSDHVACAREAAVRAGQDPEAAARGALGDLEAMRASLEAVEPAFRITRAHALARGLAAGVAVAIVVDQLQAVLAGSVAALAALAIVVVLAPRRSLDLLRAELRMPRIRGSLGTRGRPIGPALAYAVTVTAAPFVVWIALIVVRVVRGMTTFETPWSAFAVAVAVNLLLAVEAVRARRAAVA